MPQRPEATKSACQQKGFTKSEKYIRTTRSPADWHWESAWVGAYNSRSLITALTGSLALTQSTNAQVRFPED